MADLQNDNYLMYLSTVQGTSIKILTESLKEVLTDINIHFNSAGLKVMNMDPNQISFVSLKLDADKFQEFYCPEPQLAGVNMMSLHKLLKTISNNDTISMYITKDKPDKLGINIQNKKKRINNNILYNLLDVDLIDIGIPDIKYDANIIMSCGDFQKYCRELANFSNFVNFEVSKDKVFRMKIDGKSACQTVNIEEAEDNSVLIELDDNMYTDKNNIDIGRFSLRFLNLFCKSSTLCSTIRLYMKAEYPIILIYSVASLGTVKYCLCQQNEIND
jgi:proliferating cell nuclear antigen PCNA